MKGIIKTILIVVMVWIVWGFIIVILPDLYF